MSSSEEVITSHSSVSYNQHNGDVHSIISNRPSRATMESIKSVHDNPFYKNFGIRHTAPTYPRQVNRSGALEQVRHLSSNGRSSSIDDDIGEYRPGSGYVHKLLDKFSSLTAREESTVTVTHLKRSSSLDELPLDNETTKDKPIISRVFEKPSYLSAAKLAQKARSIDNLNHTHHKSNHSHAVSLHHVETKLERDRQFAAQKPQRDSHSFTLDADLARDDIIIIENASVSSLKDLSETEIPKVVGSHETVLFDELPKPNTVLTVRSIFESASVGSGLYSRRQKLDSPLSSSSLSAKLASSPLQSAAFSTFQDDVFNRVSLQSPPPVTSPKLSSETHAKPIQLSSSSTVLKTDNLRHTSDSHLYSKLEVSKSSSATTVPSSSGINLSRSRPSSSQQVHHSEDKPISPSDFSSVPTPAGRFSSFERERDNSLERTGSPDNLQPTFSLHSSKSAHTIKNDDHPVMIFSKSNLSPKRNKQQRVTNYSDDIDAPKGTKNEEVNNSKDNMNTKEVRKVFEGNNHAKVTPDTSSKGLPQRNIFNHSNRVHDNTIHDQDKVIYKKSHTTIEIKSTSKGTVDGKHLPTEDKSKNKDSDVESKNNVTKSRTIAPEPPVQLGSQSNSPANDIVESTNKHSTPSLTSKAQPVKEKLFSNSPDSINTRAQSGPETHLEKSATSKRSYPNDAPALNEQPLSKVSKDKPDSTNEQPIKGIPSIIAQRLKKQHSDPSQAADDVITSSDVTEDGSIYSRTNLTPASANTEKDTLCSEIENEIANVRKKMEGSRSKSSGQTQIFDSTQLSKKRKEKQQQQQTQEQIPRLDLPGITNDYPMEYQPKPKFIPPCNIVFIGENAKTSRSLLIKKRKIKISIHFNDTKTETFEYPSEEIALERYLEDHPHEREEILVLEDFSGGGDESSDDVEIDVFETPVTPRGNTEDDLLKSNTALAHTGSLQSYKGRFQQDYEFGMILLEKPPETRALEPEPDVDPEKLMLRPAEEDDTNTWSTNSSSDILF